MKLLKKAFGVYATNCYILQTKLGDFIIDPGQNSAPWVLENATNPRAILNTHGHFDHIWCNAELKNALGIPLLCPKNDAFMLKSDCFDLGLTPQAPDIEVNNNARFRIDAESLREIALDSTDSADSTILQDSTKDFAKDSVESTRDSTHDSTTDSTHDSRNLIIEFMTFPGHTPGCSMIKIGDFIFSGDFIFRDTIGRYDFPYSSQDDMFSSLTRFCALDFDAPLYPGHGENTSIAREQANIKNFILRS